MLTLEVGMFIGNNVIIADTNAVKGEVLNLFMSSRSNSLFPLFFADSNPLNYELPDDTGRMMV